MAHYKGAAAEATRAMHIMKRRERAKEELDLKKRKLEEGFNLNLSTIDKKFDDHHDSIEAQLRSSTVGLVTLEEMRQRQMKALEERQKQLAQKDDVAPTTSKVVQRPEQETATVNLKSKALSFGYDDDDDDDDEDDDDDDGAEAEHEDDSKKEQDQKVTVDKPADSSHKLETIKSKVLDVDTSFLPDREREEEERCLREKLAVEWRERQQRLKEEEIEITFSYWDGSGHRRVVKMKKGNSIHQFLQACLENLRKDFNELRSVSADQLMYVKEDLIIPHHYTFYDFIVTKARGKSGPLFSFDVHEDVRLTADASVEKDESHAGKVLMRNWYERNKHIFPASRWEPYDPQKSYEKYTISDKRNK